MPGKKYAFNTPHPFKYFLGVAEAAYKNRLKRDKLVFFDWVTTHSWFAYFPVIFFAPFFALA
jgi:hypothetical protein